jgi:hypothetical protein
MRSARRVSTYVLGLLVLSLGAVAAQEPQPERDQAEAEETPAARVLTLGLITELKERSIQIRPWSPDLPRRVLVTVAEGARYFHQHRIPRRSLAQGSLVMLVREPAPARRKDAGGAPSGAPPSVKARGLIQFWPAPEGKVPDEDSALARSLMAGARGYFRGWKRGGMDPPRGQNDLLLGLLTSTSPMTLVGRGGERAVSVIDDAVIVSHRTMKPEELKRGDTILVLSTTPPGVDATLLARVIARCPEPVLGSDNLQRLYQREEGIRPR